MRYDRACDTRTRRNCTFAFKFPFYRRGECSALDTIGGWSHQIVQGQPPRGITRGVSFTLDRITEQYTRFNRPVIFLINGITRPDEHSAHESSSDIRPRAFRHACCNPECLMIDAINLRNCQGYKMRYSTDYFLWNFHY